MSSHYGYIIRKHPRGGFTAVAFDDNDYNTNIYPEALDSDPQYLTIAHAQSAVWEDWSEYGIRLHIEVLEGHPFE